MIDIKGQPLAFSIAGDRQHSFMLPADRTVIPEPVAKALTKATTVRDKNAKDAAKTTHNYAARAEANQALKDALGDVYEAAAAGASAACDQYQAAYDHGARRYARALAEAQEALQQMATARQMWSQAKHGHGVGLDTAANPGIALLHGLGEELSRLPQLPAIDGR
ncbi:hypothetical protein [Actinacidiphila acidipaludis]|uniref:Uncharacterized protein n=1 Tax=Actinacidiphila acidipaludis TaxID=2873382 RepID=A0ABS7QDA2_9ACTN|nr:hypothetical protein [Streptomyces acidipaludis]MBY8879749.1 hypothetical protein [Streptomyces acidipaludis]